jgi:hypothetical protein
VLRRDLCDGPVERNQLIEGVARPHSELGHACRQSSEAVASGQIRCTAQLIMTAVWWTERWLWEAPRQTTIRASATANRGNDESGKL